MSRIGPAARIPRRVSRPFLSTPSRLLLPPLPRRQKLSLFCQPRRQSRQRPCARLAASRLLFAPAAAALHVSQQRGRASSSFCGDDATIYALSSAPGKAGIAVIRVSGPACLDIYKALCPSAPALRPRYAAVRTLYGPQGGSSSSSSQDGPANVLDQAVVLYFAGPKTVTGEDVLELHVHGGPATVKAVLAAIPAAESASASASASASVVRYAEPGEFTRRAFMHDRLDLAQVEALGDALDAETEQQRRAAVAGGSGERGETYEGWRAQLLAARAEIEALIDFSEDQHFDESPAALLAGVAGRVRRLQAAVAAHEAGGDRASLLRQGIRLALVGPANAGKSSLMNLVVGREASIVSHEAGTTRDVVEARLDIRGYLCTFADTAGFRAGAATEAQTEAATATPTQPVGSIEAEGMRRARQTAADSDVVMVLSSVELQPQHVHSSASVSTSTTTSATISTISATTSATSTTSPSLCVRYDAETLRLAAQARQRLVVLNKCDLAPDAHTLATLVADLRAAVAQADDISSSSSSGGGSSSASGGGEGGDAEARPSLPPIVLVSCRAAEAAAAGGAPEAGDPTALASIADPTDPTDQTGPDPGGIRRLVDRLADAFAAMTALPPDAQHLLGVTARQQQLLAQCRLHLQDFLDEAVPRMTTTTTTTTSADEPDEPDVVLAAEHLRWAAACLGCITGRGEASDMEEVLGVIFEKFCVGK